MIAPPPKKKEVVNILYFIVIVKHINYIPLTQFWLIWKSSKMLLFLINYTAYCKKYTLYIGIFSRANHPVGL